MLESRVRDIMTTELVGVPAGTMILEALARMVERRISCLFVKDGDKPLGIITERGVLKHAAAGRSLESIPVTDIMDSPVKSIRAGRKLGNVCGLLGEHKLRHLGVVDKNGVLCGLLTQSNLVEALGFDYFVSNARVRSIMSGGVVTLGGGSKASDSLSAIVGKGISCVVIMDGMEPGGIITERDLCRMLGIGLDPAFAACSEVMSSPVVAVRSMDTVAEAVMAMRKHSIRHIVVTGEEGVEGIVTQSDLVRGHELLATDCEAELVVN